MKNCTYGFLCSLGVEKDALFAVVIITLVLWYLVRKFRYQAYARRNYPGIREKEATFNGRWPLEFAEIKIPKLRSMYLRYTIEVYLLFVLALVIIFL